tara:strand:+ start:110 stop:370 length:261 start_codon:yes stop_codon:yes gene_type:complete
MSSLWKYKNDLGKLHERMAKETDPKVIQEHTCPKCGDYAFKDEIEAYGMCWHDYEIASPNMAALEIEASTDLDILEAQQIINDPWG